MVEPVIDKTAIVNWALTEIGVGAQFSLDDDSDLSVQVRNTWQRCVEHCFSLTNWSFARRTFKLSRLADTPNNGWGYGFLLPGDKNGPPLRVLSQAGAKPRTLRSYDIEGRAVFADIPEVWALCKIHLKPDEWDPAFRSGFVVALSGFLAVPVKQDKNLAKEFLERAFGTKSEKGGGGVLGRLADQDAASAPTGQGFLDEDPLTEAHSGVSSASHWHGRY
ncbi:hypothetical protein [Pseudovibrio sp. POLY-S9]|uniref:hypothetical protein n=1 Tax=Pseudovibrio sp. POLY-S9 TaxID=1576596 RepID=UPI000710875F|nr:hypothetical protein [Pseudovibrio sp. POLY-S9]